MHAHARARRTLVATKVDAADVDGTLQAIVHLIPHRGKVLAAVAPVHVDLDERPV